MHCLVCDPVLILVKPAPIGCPIKCLSLSISLSTITCYWTRYKKKIKNLFRLWNKKKYPYSVLENHRTCQTFPMARPQFLTRDFTNFNRTYKAHQTNIWWIMKVFPLHCHSVFPELFGEEIPEISRVHSISARCYMTWLTPQEVNNRSQNVSMAISVECCKQAMNKEWNYCQHSHILDQRRGRC